MIFPYTIPLYPKITLNNLNIQKITILFLDVLADYSHFSFFSIFHSISYSFLQISSPFLYSIHQNTDLQL